VGLAIIISILTDMFHFMLVDVHYDMKVDFGCTSPK